MLGIFQASADGVDSCREYSREYSKHRPMVWTHAGNIPGNIPSPANPLIATIRCVAHTHMALGA
eukprot:1190813-Prorocentrum_minimum.AAC.1